MAGSIIDSLFVRLGFKVEPEGLQSFAKNLNGVKQMIGAAFGFAVIKRVGAFVEQTVEAAAKVHDMADAYDVTSTKMAAMEEVAIANSVSLDQMASAYRGVSEMAGQAAMGIGRGAKLFQDLGLQAKDGTGKAKTGMEVLGDVAEKMSKISSTERQAMAGRLRIDPLLARQMARMGRDKFMAEIAAAERSGILSEEDYNTADSTAIAFKQLHHTVRQFFSMVAIQLGPTVQELNAEFRQWVQSNKDLIKQKTKEFFERVREVGSKVIDVVRTLAKHTTLLKIVFGAIIAQKMGVMFVGWLGPIMKFTSGLKQGAAGAELMKTGLAGLRNIAAGGLLAALGLVIEDLWSFYQGGESVTGWLLERFPYAVEVAKGAIVILGAALLGLTTGSGPLALLVLGVGGLVIAAQSLKDAWNPVTQWFGEVWDSLTEKIHRFAEAVYEPIRAAAKFVGIDLPAMGKATAHRQTPEEYAAQAAAQEASAYKRPQAGLGVLDYPGGNMLTWGRGLAPAAAAAGAGGGNTTNITQTVGPTTIQVNGAGDPGKVAAEVMRQQDRRRQLARQQTRDAQPAHR